MQIGDARRELRSNLLPRESQFDARGHFQEIDRLEAEVEMTLPAEHEWSVRSRHLLAKATDILQNSPQRSAEVDYYLQQVRSILERAQQTYRWSLIYAKRLKIYLGSWALLSVVVIVASLLYAEPLVEILLPDSSATSIYWTQNFIALTITVFAGTLGAAIGALRNMLFYRSVGRGFVDRKYSLRGLFLPLMAGLFGLFIYLLFGIIYYFADIEPLQNLIGCWRAGAVGVRIWSGPGVALRHGRLILKMQFAEVVVNVPIRRTFTRRYEAAAEIAAGR